MEGLRVRVSVSQHQGGRAYMEDFSAVSVDPDQETACFAVYDGHGGRDAAQFCQTNLWNNIRKKKMFRSPDETKVKASLQQGFLDTQASMWNSIESWSKHRSGHYNSTAGSTASVVVIKNNKLFVAHVGDSTAVLCRDEGTGLKAVQLTDEHKPNSPVEQARIEALGGRVEKRGSIYRVAWKRVRQPHKGPIRRSTTYETVPFLAVARALGNLWSYDYFSKQYAVSPDPDIYSQEIKPGVDRYIVVASDGIWNVMSNEDVANFVHSHQGQEDVARRLVFEALRRWGEKGWRADNITAIVLEIDPEPVKSLYVTASGTTSEQCSYKFITPPRAAIPLKRTLSSNDLNNVVAPLVKRHRSLPSSLLSQNTEY